ncbi:unnamed protein product [Meganyctiphanes norvegica]|uniref:Uncharacterized protein n=1 Tax=Meganyctiphanes norvegica TaxID=48144 RepID=A0AAV2SKI0_MEGNR
MHCRGRYIDSGGVAVYSRSLNSRTVMTSILATVLALIIPLTQGSQPHDCQLYQVTHEQPSPTLEVAGNNTEAYIRLELLSDNATGSINISDGASTSCQIKVARANYNLQINCVGEETIPFTNLTVEGMNSIVLKRNGSLYIVYIYGNNNKVNDLRFHAPKLDQAIQVQVESNTIVKIAFNCLSREPVPETEPAAEPEAEPDAEPEAEPEAPAEPESDAEPESSAEPESPAEPEPSAESEPSAEPESPAEPKSEAEPESSTEPESPAEPEPSAESEPSAEPESPAEPEPTSEPEVLEGSMTIVYVINGIVVVLFLLGLILFLVKKKKSSKSIDIEGQNPRVTVTKYTDNLEENKTDYDEIKLDIE